MNVATLEAPTLAGTPFAGGLYAGRFFIGALAYALIVSPKDAGELVDIAWNSSNKNVKNALSYNDGLANTVAMAKAGSFLAERIQALRIGGFDDWYLPSRLESLLLFGELQKQFDMISYWTSTQSASYPAYAWYQGFSDGFQSSYHESDDLRARAVRRLPL